MAIHHRIPNIFVFCSHIQAINTARSYAFISTDELNQTSRPFQCRLLSYSVSMVAGRFDLRKQVELGGNIFPPVFISSSIALMNGCSASCAGGQFPAGQGGSYSLVDTLSTKHRSHRRRLLSYSVSMVSSRFDLRKQVELGGSIFLPGVQGSKGPHGPQQSSSVRQLV
ncbi:hypothetical protein CLU79DRAFT_892479 [Phycomyces nitens]|nr:hypothetical protein CLU79DRAFT_892479 [Phycomyces nitens]